MPNQLYTVFIRLPLSLRILFIALSSVLGFGILVYLIEPETFPTIFDGIWWAVITASTVGYGDLVPQTFLGKIMGILLILSGAGFLSTYLVTIAASTVTRQNAFMEGKVQFKGKKHTVLIGWNERTRELLQSLAVRGENTCVTLIDETLKSHPLPTKNVHFIQGRPSLDTVLMQANICEAEKVIITADQGKDELQADMNSILTLLAVKGLNPHVTCVVEILRAEQMINAKRAGADEIIRTNHLISSIMHNSLSSHTIVTAFLDLLDPLTETSLTYKPAYTDDIEHSFAELTSQYILQGKLLLGVKRESKTIINPPPTFQIQTEDELIIITH